MRRNPNNLSETHIVGSRTRQWLVLAENCPALRLYHIKLLESTRDKIEAIAETVGYENPFVFSNTFKKWIGWRPSEYRRRGGN